MIKLKLNTTENLDHIFLSPIALYLLILVKFSDIFKYYGVNMFFFLYLSVMPDDIFEHTWSIVDEDFLIQETKKNKKYKEMKIQIAANTNPTQYLNVCNGKLKVVENECVLDINENQFNLIENTLNHFFLPMFNGNVSYEKVLEVEK